MNFDAILLAIVTCFSTLLGGTFAARRRKNIGVLGAFAAGVLITTSLLDLLPQTFRLATSINVLLEDVMALTVVGFLFLYVISRVVSHHAFSNEGEYVEVKHPFGGLFATSTFSAQLHRWLGNRVWFSSRHPRGNHYSDCRHMSRLH